MLSSNDEATKVHDKLVELDNKSSVIKLAGFDFFSKYHKLKTRAVIGIGLVSDAWKGGHKGVGPAKLNSIITKIAASNDMELDLTLIKFYAKKMSTSERIME